jgi:hypothetical protein
MNITLMIIDVKVQVLTFNTLQVGKPKLPQPMIKWKVQKGQLIKQITFKYQQNFLKWAKHAQHLHYNEK